MKMQENMVTKTVKITLKMVKNRESQFFIKACVAQFTKQLLKKKKK